MPQNNSPAQTEQQITPKVMPDFCHRLPENYDPACPDYLIHEVETILERSKGMLSLISDLHFETHINQISSDNVSLALKSVINELNDVFALVATYHDAIANQQN